MSNYAKLKTNLKLAIQRLKLLEKKKTELSLKSRREIADYIGMNKADRARIRVEHIIREDNFVEAMELLEMFCDLLLARFGLIEKMKELDPGLDEAIATLIWSAPRISNDILEFKVIGDILAAKYGKSYAEACKTDKTKSVNEKVKRRLGVEPPPKLLVEQYLIEIAKNFNVHYVPDQSVMLGQPPELGDLINLGNNSNSGGAGGFSAGPGFVGGTGGGHISSPHYGEIGFEGTPAGYPVQKPAPFNNYRDSNSNVIGSGSGTSNFVMPVLPPPLPNTFPEGDDQPNDLFGYNDNRKSLPPPYGLDRNNNELPPFDLSDPINIKRALNNSNTGPIVEPDPNVPLPYKPGMNDPSPPPIYQEKKFPPKYNNNNNNGGFPAPSAPVRGQSAKSYNQKNELDDLPSVPDYTPTRRNQNEDEDDDDVTFDDLQKRFNNLKK